MNAHTRGKTFVSLALCLIAMTASSGCYQMLAAWTVLTGGEWNDAKFKLGEGPLLILFDDLDDLVTEPRALKEVHETISQIFYRFKINRLVVPFEDWRSLRQTDQEYDGLSIRQIGEKLGAEQVLYLRVVRFTLTDEPGADIYKGSFIVRVKVLSTGTDPENLLWPDTEPSGYKVESATAPEPIDGDRSSFQVAKELSIRLGQEVAKLFYGHKAADN